MTTHHPGGGGGSSGHHENVLSVLLRRWCNLNCFNEGRSSVSGVASSSSETRRVGGRRVVLRREDIGLPMDFRHVAHLGHGDVVDSAGVGGGGAARNIIGDEVISSSSSVGGRRIHHQQQLRQRV